jgi:hypothetical protein
MTQAAIVQQVDPPLYSNDGVEMLRIYFTLALHTPNQLVQGC